MALISVSRPHLRSRLAGPLASAESSSSSDPVRTVNKPLTSPHSDGFNYALSSSHGKPVLRLVRAAESNIEKTIFDFRFLAPLAVGGSLAGSILCFLSVYPLP